MHEFGKEIWGTELREREIGDTSGKETVQIFTINRSMNYLKEEVEHTVRQKIELDIQGYDYSSFENDAERGIQKYSTFYRDSKNNLDTSTFFLRDDKRGIAIEAFYEELQEPDPLYTPDGQLAITYSLDNIGEFVIIVNPFIGDIFHSIFKKGDTALTFTNDRSGFGYEFFHGEEEGERGSVLVGSKFHVEESECAVTRMNHIGINTTFRNGDQIKRRFIPTHISNFSDLKYAITSPNIVEWSDAFALVP